MMTKKRDNLFMVVGGYKWTKFLHEQLIDQRDMRDSEVTEAAVRIVMISRRHLEEAIPDIALAFVEEECSD